MEILFQVGKELATLEARVKAIEEGECSCKGKGRAAKDSELPKEQLATVKQLREKHAKIFAGFNKVLKDLKIPGSVVVGRFTLKYPQDLVGVDDEDQCCICCLDGAGGYEYCCDYAGCSCCD